MKKKILSVFLAAMLLLACLAPAVLAANESDTHSHTDDAHSHIDDTVLYADSEDFDYVQSSATGRYNASENTALITLNISSYYDISSVNFNLDIENIFFTDSWFGSVQTDSGTVNSYNTSGVLNVTISDANSTTVTVEILIKVPTDYIGQTLQCSIYGSVEDAGSDSAKEFSTEVSIAACSHRLNGVLVYESHVIKKATCSSGGIQGYFCKICKARLLSSDGAPADEVTILPTDHVPGEKVTIGVSNINATCTTNGIQYYECADCHSVINKGIVIPASHKINTSTITWNDTEKAWYAKCSDCSTLYNVSATKTKCTCETKYGKNYAKVIASKTPTCGVMGYKAYQCQLCNISWVESEGSALLDHSWGAWITTTPATCTTPGVQTSTCSVCNQTKTQTLPATGHNFDPTSYQIITPSTCTTKGTATKTCLTCGAVEQFEMNLKEHAYDSGVITKEATCSETGIKTYTCADCAHKKTETIAIDPNNHDFESEIVKEATCLNDGLEISTCKNCSHKVETVIEAKGHTWRIDEQTDKYTKKTCVVCRTIWEQKKSKDKTNLSIKTSQFFTIDISDTAIAEKDVVFHIDSVEFPQETATWFDSFFDEGKYDAKYQGAYTAKLIVDGTETDFNGNMNISVDLGETYKNKEIFVVYITDQGTPSAKIAAERDGSSIVISGADFEQFADKTFVVMTSNERAGISPVIAIIICAAVVAIACVAVVLIIKSGNKGNGKNKGMRV